MIEAKHPTRTLFHCFKRAIFCHPSAVQVRVETPKFGRFLFANRAVAPDTLNQKGQVTWSKNDDIGKGPPGIS